MLHKASISFISRRQKTAKTACGKVVKASNIAVNVDADCPDCRAFADNELEGMKTVLASCPADSKAAEAFAKYEPLRYRTEYFL